MIKYSIRVQPLSLKLPKKNSHLTRGTFQLDVSETTAADGCDSCTMTLITFRDSGRFGRGHRLRRSKLVGRRKRNEGKQLSLLVFVKPRRFSRL